MTTPKTENDQPETWYDHEGVYPDPSPVEAFVLVPMPEKARPAAILAVHHLEAREADPSVEQYVDAVLGVIYRPGQSGAES